MLQSLLSDLRLYRLLLSIQLKTQTQYKTNLLIDIVTYFGVTALEFISLLLFFIPFPSLLGWHLGEVALLAAIMSISFGLSEMVGAGIDNFSFLILRGDFDRILLRPVGAFIQVIGSDFRLRRLGRITQGILGFALAIHFLAPTPIHWTIDKLVVLGIGILSGTVIFTSILLLGATVCFWTIEATELTNILTYGGREMLSYPLTIYNQTLQRFFLYVIPVAFGTYVPTCYILDRALPFGLPRELAFGAPLPALIFALVAGQVWNIGIRHYQSTGT
jgi:ABC-2 type transport system permease protein